MPAYFLSVSINSNPLASTTTEAKVPVFSRIWLLLVILLLPIPVIGADDDLSSGLLNTSQSSLSNSLSESEQLLHAEEAFSLTVSQGQGRNIQLNWRIKEGYYLYRDSISINSGEEETGIQLLSLSFPESETIEDEYFGVVEIYKTSLNLNFNATQAENSLTLTINYQGCAEELYCYPMQNLTVPFTFASSRP